MPAFWSAFNSRNLRRCHADFADIPNRGHPESRSTENDALIGADSTEAREVSPPTLKRLIARRSAGQTCVHNVPLRTQFLAFPPTERHLPQVRLASRCRPSIDTNAVGWLC